MSGEFPNNTRLERWTLTFALEAAIMMQMKLDQCPFPPEKPA